MNTAAARNLIENFLSDDYLFNEDNASWRALFESRNGTIPLSQFMSFAEVSRLVGSPQELVNALKGSQKVTLVDETSVRRQVSFDPTKDPSLRTVFIKPIHEHAKDEDIKQFIAKFNVTPLRVTRKTFTSFDPQSRQQSQKKKPSALVELKTIEDAKKLCDLSQQGLLSYGSLGNMGDRFLPKLTASMKSDQTPDDAAESPKQQHPDSPAAQLSSTSTTPVALKPPIKPAPDGAILVVPNSKSDWKGVRDAVAKVCKGVSSIVYAKQIASPQGGNRTYLIMKTAAGAQHILKEYHSFLQDIGAVVPSIELCVGDEESNVRHAFYQEGVEQWTRKIAEQENKKRLRDD
eukprot:PhF_6_TR28335/c0_g1_i1/m.42004